MSMLRVTYFLSRLRFAGGYFCRCLKGARLKLEKTLVDSRVGGYANARVARIQFEHTVLNHASIASVAKGKRSKKMASRFKMYVDRQHHTVKYLKENDSVWTGKVTLVFQIFTQQFCSLKLERMSTFVMIQPFPMVSNHSLQNISCLRLTHVNQTWIHFLNLIVCFFISISFLVQCPIPKWWHY